MRPRIALAGLLLAALIAVGGSTVASASAPKRATSPKPVFRTNIGRAMGLVPHRGEQDPATGSNYEVVYHGGSSMTGTVTIHTIFWAPSGYQFSGSPGPGIPGYQAMIQQFFGDVAHDSGQQTNIFSILGQYGDNTARGGYSIAYNPAVDSINDTQPYPAQSDQCPSPSGTSTCITDSEVAAEVSRIIQTTDPGGNGLHDLWQVYLPPNVDECIALGECGTNFFGAYHSWEDEGHGPFVYALMIDPLIETGADVAGADPEGNPDAETTVTVAAHETIEAITNPFGDAWMDPNGNEVADKCESGQLGTPIGYATDGSPYNQVINGHEYAIQEMWSNTTTGCEQSSTSTNDNLPLPEVSLRQFSPTVSGRIGSARAGVKVLVGLLRAGSAVARGSTYTRSNGTWGPVALRSAHGALHATGDDRDEVIVEYGRGGPGPDLIAPGSGGDPFSQAGWTGWLDLDTGSFVLPNSVSVAPCSQVGVLTVTVNGRALASPTAECGSETDAATVFSPKLNGASRVTLTSEDNRAPTAFAPLGALVSLTVPVGEPDSFSNLFNANVPFPSSGLPACTAELRLQQTQCTGLVPGARYTLTRRRGAAVRHARADFTGTAVFRGMGLRGGDLLALTNTAGRTLTLLHVAHIRVAIKGNQTVVASGTCQPGDYWGAPLTKVPSSSQVDFGGAAGIGTICPDSGKAGGLSDAVIEQVDDLSGGATRTSVPLLEGSAPSNDAIVSGPFRAMAQTAVPGPHGEVATTGAAVALTITPEGSHHPVFQNANVTVPDGVPVGALPAGVYDTRWVVRDVNGDTRTVLGRFDVSG